MVLRKEHGLQSQLDLGSNPGPAFSGFGKCNALDEFLFPEMEEKLKGSRL